MILNPIDIDVALVPAQARQGEGQICILVDVLRASSMIVTLFEQGAKVILPTGSVGEAKRLAKAYGYRLGGERDGLRVVGFDFGNSPTEIERYDMSSSGIVFTTSNGTFVMKRLARAKVVLIGCLLNARACCAAAIQLAIENRVGVKIVCAGKQGAFLLDDAACAGYLVDSLVGQITEEKGYWQLTDAANAAHRLYCSFDNMLDAFLTSSTGRRIVELGQEADLAFCARHNSSQCVPMLLQATPLRIEPRVLSTAF